MYPTAKHNVNEQDFLPQAAKQSRAQGWQKGEVTQDSGLILLCHLHPAKYAGNLGEARAGGFIPGVTAWRTSWP